MSTKYAQLQTTVQKNDVPSVASVLDVSSQSEALQRKADLANAAAQRAAAPRPNNTGMPDSLKSGIESLSGFSMDNVRVHYNSSKPATVQALAYTQGTDIHVAPGQEKCLPHEAWHVAQQMAGRVSPTTNINGMPVNDNAALEHEADVMGEMAVQCKYKPNVISDVYLEKKCLQREEFNVNGNYSNRLDAIKAISEFAGNYAVDQEKKRDEYVKSQMSSKFGKQQTQQKQKKQQKQQNVKLSDYFGPFKHNFKSNYGENPKFDLILKYNFDFRINEKNINKYVDEILNSLNDKPKNAKDEIINIIHNVNGKDEKVGDAHGYVIEIKDNDFSAGMKEYSEQSNTFAQNHVTHLNYNRYSDDSRIVEENLKSKIMDVKGDAYTKLAGEGARFQCVRNNMSLLTNNTNFYCRILGDGFVACKFKDLWNDWASSFDKKFNISDDEVANKMRNGGISVQNDCTPSLNDVNLDLESDCGKFDCIKRMKNSVTPYSSFGTAEYCVTYDVMGHLLDVSQNSPLQFPIHDKDLYGWILKNINKPFIKKEQAENLIDDSDSN